MAGEIPRRPTSLQRQKQQVTVDALIDAARRGMIEHGLDVTVDDIAALAGVGRRTVFRHFPTREDLLREALAESFTRYVRALPDYSGGDWLAWLTDVALVSHQTVARAGRLLWDLRTRRLPSRLVEPRDRFQRVLGDIAETLWQAAGGEGAAPRELRQAVAAHLSPMFTQAVLLDADGTPELAAELATDAIAATVRGLVNPTSAA
jgi:AcrR family transcriptional regulator